MSEMQRKTKLAIIVTLFLGGAPLYLLSEGGMQMLEKRFKEDESSPKAPVNLWRLARTYDITWRPEKCDAILKKWFYRYGGDESDYPREEWALKIYGYPWTDESPRPAGYPKRPHPLTGKVLVTLAEHEELARHYVEATHIFQLVVSRYNEDPESVQRAQAALLRNKTRSF